MTEAERLAQALENACRDWDGRELKKPVATCTELRQAAAELRRLSADAQRLTETRYREIRLTSEVMAWRARFPQHIYRPQDDCVALKLGDQAMKDTP